MKSFLIIAISFWFILQNNNMVVLSEIHNSYLKEDTCRFTITNNSEDKLLYYITLEIKVRTVWKEILYSIDNPIDKLAPMIPIKSNERIDRSIIFKEIFNDHVPENDTLRFKVIYCFNNEAHFGYSYSDEFVIK